MNNQLSTVFEILHDAETAQREGFCRIGEILSLNPVSPVSTILCNPESPVYSAPFRGLLTDIHAIVEAHSVQRNITDWPFEHFWGNPYETKHSKLLGYFINPEENHGCAVFLLKTLLQALLGSGEPSSHHRLPVDTKCRVLVERDYIDILIQRDCDDGKYAVIVENKVNGAVNQDKQLQTYVELLLHKRGYTPEQIFVFYLPLTSDQLPDSDDEAVIRTHGINYKHVTFDKHILEWLNLTLSPEAEVEWPKTMYNGMRDNLSHYRNLLLFLVKRQRTRIMDAQILRQLAQADKNNALPALSEVLKLQESAAALQQCLESVLRGRLLLRLQVLLKERAIDSWFYSEDQDVKQQPLQSAFDERFAVEQNLCIAVNDAPMVCVGAYGSEPKNGIVWLGYMRNGNKGKTEVPAAVVMEVAKNHLHDLTKTWRPWYVWDWQKSVTYDNCSEDTTAMALIDKLLAMRDALVTLVNKPVPKKVRK